jgi:hypothetical protein
VTTDELQRLWDEWEAKTTAESARAAAANDDDYFWHGASSFKDYIEEHLEPDQKKDKANS